MISEDFEKTSIALMELTNINLDDRKFNSYKNKLSIGLIRVFDDEFQIKKRYKVTLGEHSYMENYFNPKMELIKQPSVAENDLYNIDRSFFIEIQKITSYNIYYKKVGKSRHHGTASGKNWLKKLWLSSFQPFLKLA